MPINLRSGLDTGVSGDGHAARVLPAVDTEQSVTGLSIGQYLIRRLSDYGIRHVFGTTCSPSTACSSTARSTS
jgi:hypothetical protein